jgi:mannose-6-phosphate isomerase-like protein (cupin superfamily)
MSYDLRFMIWKECVVSISSTNQTFMKIRLTIATIAGLFILATTARAAEGANSAHATSGGMQQPIFSDFKDLKWDKILPDLGDRSPEICVLHVDPTTKATKLMIRTPKGIHIRKHWHSANETHMIIKGIAKFECDGKRSELGPGSFNYMPAKMVHEAWLPADSLTFITVDAGWDVNWVEGPPAAADLAK